MKKKNIFCFIFARGGSKGIKNKNLSKLNRKPLLHYSINLAKKIKAIKKIYVSTDSKVIATYAKKKGADIIKRPKKISGDNSKEIDAWKHAIKYLRNKKIFFDNFLSLPTTSPLRTKNDVIKSINMLKGKTDIILTANKSKRNPWFNMVKKNKKGFYEIVIKSTKNIHNRQLAPKVLDLTTAAYVSRAKYIMKAKSYFDGNVKINLIPPERSLDIDSKEDLNYAEYLMKSRKKNR